MSTKREIVDAGYSEIMFGYAMEDVDSPSTIKVYIPAVMCDKQLADPKDEMAIPSTQIFQNDTSCTPSVTGTAVISNYLSIPTVITDLSITFNTPASPYVDPNGIYKHSIKKGDRLLLAFANKNPRCGYIIGK